MNQSQMSTNNNLVKTLTDTFPDDLEPAKSKKSSKSIFSSFFSGSKSKSNSNSNSDDIPHSLESNSGSKKKSSIFSALSFTPDESSNSSSRSSNSSSNSRSSNSSLSNMGTGFFAFIGNLSWITWLVIVIILAFLGFNIFIYLAQTTQFFSSILASILAFFNKYFGTTGIDTAKQTTSVSATGTQSAVNIAASTATSGLNAVQQVSNPNTNTNVNTNTNTNSNTNTSNMTSAPVAGINGTGNQSGQTLSSTMPQKDISQTTTLNAALNDASAETGKNPIDEGPYQSDDAYSSIQMNKSTSKAGWCYIGEERNFRSCSEVGVNDMCMSGDIFPTQDICINPSLRQ